MGHKWDDNPYGARGRRGHIIWGHAAHERFLRMQARCQRWRRRLSMVRGVASWLRVYWWIILVWLLVAAFIFLGCPWIEAKVEAQAVIRAVEWRGAFDADGVHQLARHDFPEVADVPDWERHYQPVVVPDLTAKNLAYMDVWCEKNPL